MGKIVVVHSGIKGQKWGFRIYRNYDGTLTEEGRKRYDYYENKTDRVYRTARLKQLGEKTYVNTNIWGIQREDLSRFTNDELKALTYRAKLEKEYREAFNTEQYTKGKRILEGFKTAGKEASYVLSIGKNMLDNVNGIREALSKAREITDNEAERLNRKAEKLTEKVDKEKEKSKRKANNEAVQDFILSIDNSGKRNALIKMLDSISGKGKTKGVYDYGNITPEMLEKIKKMSKY